MNQDINPNTDSAGTTSPEEPLVSIIVITYNSAKYVLETLESAKAQTYQNIELIVSDDCSTDYTVAICRDWINENKGRFVRTELITSEKNTGISANCNRGVHAALGDWIKYIAGDDILHAEAIRLLVSKVIISNGDIKIIFGACMRLFDNEIERNIKIPPVPFIESDAKAQHYFLIQKGNYIDGPTSFLNKQTLLNLGCFDERIKYSEDWPLWIKATNSGHRLFFIEDVVAYYRVHIEGIYSKTDYGQKYDPRLRKSVNLVRELYLLPNLKSARLYFDYWHNWLILKKERNSTTWLQRTFYYLLQITDIRAISNLFR